ncbi:MAG: hypothetical protein A3F09_05940 [Chlamydiae bacterium RIFCSPHIGHO2_12_FULL_49_11]|nr:MAG: hypothetical protein A3F09_05940 [Chlamydiae bacterium RIFCSPHIGHO2_12_FULL_49_11]
MRRGDASISLEKAPSEAIEWLRRHPSFVVSGNFLFTRRTFRALETIRNRLPNEAFSLSDIEDEQERAVRLSLSAPFSIITGGPGTGKTTVAKKLALHAFEKKPCAKITFLAPTGKALQKLKMEGVHTSTLHKHLGLSKDGYSKEVDLIEEILLIDEASMVDLFLFERVFSSLRYVKHLILMGDPMQLPPIGMQGIFQDLCDSNRIPCTTLTRVRRTDNEEMMRIFEAIRQRDVETFLALAKPHPFEDFESRFPYLSGTGIILTPFQQGKHGAENLNARMLAAAPDAVHPIMCTKNIHELGLYNGDMGTLHQDTIRFENAIFPRRTFPYFTLGSAITIHKSQGSEYDHVIGVFPPESVRFPLELLYTALTRAKKRLSLFIDESTVRALFQTPKRPPSLFL